MKQILMIAAAALALAAFAVAQTQPAPATGKPATPAPPQAAPATGLKSPPQAKSQDEYNAFVAAVGLADGADPVAAEAAARNFQTKFPNSELAPQLFLALLFNYNRTSNLDKAADMGREVLKIEPGNPVAAIYTGLILAESTRETDLDAAQKFDEANKDANTGLQSVDTNLMLPGNPPQQQVDATKADLKAIAYDILGLVAFKRSDFTSAEKSFRQSIQTRGEPGDAMCHLRLALTLDKLNRYNDALPVAQKAASLANPQDNVAKSAQAEIERLKKLTGAGGTATPASQPATPPATPNR